MIRVLIADDQALIRSAVRDLIDGASDLEVVGEAADGREAAASARALSPDVVVMDIRMPVMDGIEATAAICQDPALAATRVLILTTFEDDDYVVSALRAGASGFIGKGAEPDDIVRAVRAVHEGDALLSPTATRALITKYLDAPARAGVGTGIDAARGESVTAREREILVEVARGRSNDEIAAALFISAHTVKTHVNRVMVKLGAHDRAQLVIWAYESGLVVPGA